MAVARRGKGDVMTRPLRRLRSMHKALRIIEFGGCEKSTNRGTYCWTRSDWSPVAHYSAEKWCDACIAAAGLRGELCSDIEEGSEFDGPLPIIDRHIEPPRPELALAQIGALHHPVDEEAELWIDGPGDHDERFPDCTSVAMCEGHTITVQVCAECGYQHDGETPIFRTWPCPTLLLVRSADR